MRGNRVGDRWFKTVSALQKGVGTGPHSLTGSSLPNKVMILKLYLPIFVTNQLIHRIKSGNVVKIFYVLNFII